MKLAGKRGLVAAIALLGLGASSVAQAAPDDPVGDVDINFDGANESVAVGTAVGTDPGRRTPDLKWVSVDARSEDEVNVSVNVGGDYDRADSVVVFDTTDDGGADYLVAMRQDDHTSALFPYSGSVLDAPRHGQGLGEPLCTDHNPYGGGFAWFDLDCADSATTFHLLGAVTWAASEGTTWRDALLPAPGTTFPTATVGGAPSLDYDRPARTASARTPSTACPDGRVPPHEFSDVPAMYDDAVSCLLWYGITRGQTVERFDPRGTVSRGQTASFMRRLLVATGMPTPAAVRDHTDGQVGVHVADANRLIELGAFAAMRNDPSPAGWFFGDLDYPSLADPLTRWSMADTMARTLQVRTSQPLRPRGDYFDDDVSDENDSFSHDALAEAGIAAGTGNRTFAPQEELTRGEMALFITRLLDHLLAEGHGSPKG